MQLIVENARIARPHPTEFHRVDWLDDAQLLVCDGIVEALCEGRDGCARIEAARQAGAEVIDARGRLLLPGFVDSHTHPVFFAHRAKEFELRNLGADYLEIQAAGGGILSSRKSLMEADPAELKERVRKRLAHFVELGTTTIEAKSGYGLSVEHELLSLRILKSLAQEEALHIRATCLAAHSVPPEFAKRRADWFHLIETGILPVVEREALAHFIDAFCEPKVISIEETRACMQAGQRHGLQVKLHADQIEAGGGAQLAAELGALSADHLERIDEAGIAAMVQAGVSFSLLPGATFFLGLSKHAPARHIIQAGGATALCTDYNPGSSHMQSMPFVLTLACSQMHLSVDESLWAATQGGARAMGMQGLVGGLEPGYSADFTLWPFTQAEQLPYACGDCKPDAVFIRGQLEAGSAQQVLTS
jgi:imidazolonepropionase